VLLSFSDEIDAIAFTTKAFDDLKVRFDQNINFQKILDLFND
jgi:hypothetical protein